MLMYSMKIVQRHPVATKGATTTPGRKATTTRTGAGATPTKSAGIKNTGNHFPYFATTGFVLLAVLL